MRLQLRVLGSRELRPTRTGLTNSQLTLKATIRLICTSSPPLPPPCELVSKSFILSIVNCYPVNLAEPRVIFYDFLPIGLILLATN